MTKKLPKIKKWFKKKEKVSNQEEVSCKNCHTVFAGNYCPECGQSVRDYDRPFSFIFFNFVGDFFAFDTRFFRTFAALLTKPGFLTKQYFEGKRVRYAPPFRIFIFVSFIMFLLLQTYTNRGLTTVLDSDLDGKIGLDSTSMAKADSIINNVSADFDSTYSSSADSVLKRMGISVDSVNPNDYNLKINMETFRDTRDLRQLLNNFADAKEKDLENVTDPKERAKMREYIRLARSPEQAVAKFLEYLSWSFFLLLPIFALILKLVYIRRKQNYMRHLIFSIHIHSFIFIIFTAIIFLYLITGGDTENASVSVSNELRNISGILLLSFPVYFMIALKKFYGQSWGKVILKFFAVSFLYNTIFWIAVGIVFLNAISVI